MKFNKERKSADLLVIPLYRGEKRPYAPLMLGDFSGKEGDMAYVYPEKGIEKRILLLGLGDKKELTTEKIRRAFGAMTKEAVRRKFKKINIEFNEIEGLSSESLLRGIVEGIMIADYSYSLLRSEAYLPLEDVTLIGLSKGLFDKIEFYQTLFEGVNLTRDLVNGNPDDVNPAFLVKTAQELGKPLILDKKALIKEKMGLILAVAQGSVHEPYLICLEYTGNPKSKDKTVIIGKGVTYDTGGLNLKGPGSGMEDMKNDMAGAAAALGVYHVVKKLKLKINLSIVIPTVENGIDSQSYKPGSVYRSHAGTTVEIGNTDAEGRLILADAISWTKKHLKPSRIIDIATLTGGMLVMVGSEGMGLFSNHDALADSLIIAGTQTYERAFRCPLIEEYRENLKSEVADLRNIGNKGREAPSIMAAMFLKEFIGDIPWAHLDIASCAYSTQGKRYYPKLATGVGVRLLVEYLRHL